MQGREKICSSRGARVVALVLLAGLIVGVVASPATAKKKKGSPAVTRSSSMPLAPSGQVTATANCRGKTHVTGGGWSVANPYSANGSDPIADDSGTRINDVQSQPAGFRSWTASAAALANPSVATSFTTYARCEANAYSSTISTVSQTSPVPVGEGRNFVLTCAGGEHVLTGGFSFSPPGDLADPFGTRATVYESRRTDRRTWTIHLINPEGAPSPVTVTVNFLCERNRKGTQVSEASRVAPIAENGRTSAAATCSGKSHSIGGGFLVSPTAAGAIPAIGVDQLQPAGAKTWQVGLFEYPIKSLPAGSSLTAYSYCKKNALPKR